MRLKKPCKRCDKLFRPVSRFSRICNKCRIKSFEISRLKIKETIKKRPLLINATMNSPNKELLGGEVHGGNF